MVNEEKDKKFQKYGLERYKNLPGDEKQRLLQQKIVLRKMKIKFLHK